MTDKKSILNIFNKRIIRAAFGLIAFFVFVVTFVPYLFSYENIDGIINARTITITTPIEGIFTFKIDNPKIGTAVIKDQLLATVNNPRIDKSYYYGLITDRESLNQKIISFKHRVELLAALESSLLDRSTLYQTYTIQKLAAEHAGYIEDLKSINAEVAFYELELARHKDLEKSKSIAKNRLDETISLYEKTKAKAESLQFLINLTAVKLAAAKDNTFLGDGHNDVPYSTQRQDEVKIIKSEIIAIIEENDKRVLDITLQIEEESQRLALMTKFVATSPFNGIVWRLPVVDNSTVVINSELIQIMNCDSLYLDVTATERNYDNIYPGLEVKYRLYGDSQFFIGYVDSIRGSGIISKDKNIAATIDSDGKREFSITVKINPDDINPVAENYCQVGRRVIVKFPQTWSF